MRKLLHATLLLCACGHYARVGAVRGRAKQVFVNGTQVLRDGEHTNAKPGRVVIKARALPRSASATAR